MDTQHHQKIKEHLQKSQQIGIVINKNPNLDPMAAGLGLYLSLKNAGKNVAIASPTDPIVEVSNLVGIDKVRKTLATENGDLTVSFPYREGEIEKVSYTLEDGYLNIIVKAAEKGLQFHEKDIAFKRGGKPFHLLFVIGVQKLQDVQTLLNPEIMKETIVINIDNKPDNEQFGNLVIVSPKFSSISEQIADFLTLPDASLPIDTDIAQNLLSGITYATNDFQDPKTSHLAFEMAGILMRKGAVRRRHVSVQEERKSQTTFIPRPQPRPLQVPQQMQQRPIQQPQQVTSQPHPIMPSQNTQPASQPQPISQEQNQQTDNKQAPADWLQPKVYKGSTFS